MFEQKEIDKEIKLKEAYHVQMDWKKPTLSFVCRKKEEKKDLILEEKETNEK